MTGLDGAIDSSLEKGPEINPYFNPQRNAYFADLHVHTKYSFDAYAFGTLATPYAAKAVVSESADFQDGAAPVRHIGTGRCQQRTATATSDNQRLDQCGR